MSSTRGAPKRHSFHYDSDDGLMDEIQKITAPPGKTFLKVVKEEIVSQKNWKSVNAQYCIVCREGGELLCCDTCPASFHLLCHEPVIHKDEIPAGKWLCNRCEHTPPHLLKPLNEQDPTETEEERNRRATQRIIEAADPEADPLSLLAQAALAVNAQQFELPQEYGALNVPFDYVKTRKRDLFNLRCRMCLIIVDKKALTKCDFCENAYHLDCLNPPLCSQPKGKWMCPNHVQAIVDHKLLKSPSVFERKRLWDEWATKKIDDIAIIRTFVKKAKKIQKKNWKKMPRGVSKGVVSQSVKEMYRRRFDNLESRVQFATEEERSIFVSTLAKMHASVVENVVMKDFDRKLLKKDVKAVMEELITKVVQFERESVMKDEPEAEEQPAKVVRNPSQQALVRQERAKALQDQLQFELAAKDETKPDTPDDLFYECMNRLKQTKNPRERVLLSMAAQRLDQLRKQTILMKKMTTSADKRYNQRCFLKDYPIMAVLKAEGDSPPIAIQRMISSIGYSDKCTIMLDEKMNGGKICIGVASNHASFVFDKFSRKFELTPTGCNRITVDGILYGSPVAPPTCFCSFPVDQIPVQQAAPLHHGSAISIGCTQFVFASFY